jgi:hypothetical protein
MIFNFRKPSSSGGGGTGVSTLTGLVKANGTSAMTAAIPGTDYVTPSGSITGNAATATKLQSAALINGVEWDGSQNITISDDTKQAYSVGLSAIAELAGTSGLLRKTGENTYVLDTNTYVTISGLSNYTLPVASTTKLGGVKAGANVTIDANGVLSANDTNVSFTEISNKPTNISGYGITDAYTKTQVDTMVGNIASALDTINGQVI